MPPLAVSDSAIITEVAGLGGSQHITKAGKWALVAQQLGLKSSKAIDVQRRYEAILSALPKDDDSLNGDSDSELAGSTDDDSSEPPGEHDVERITGHRAKKGLREFLVQWAGTAETTWEPVANLKGCPQAIAAYRKGHPDWSTDYVPEAGSWRKRDADAHALDDIDAKPRKRASSGAPMDVVLCARMRAGRCARAAASRGSQRAARERLSLTSRHASTPRRSGLIEDDQIARVIGPTSVALQWLVTWRSGRYSLLTNEQLKGESPHALFKWYEAQLVLEEE